MGGWRYVALALLAPALVLPAAAATTPAQADTTHPAIHHRTSVHRVHAPRHVRLLAARLYWGARPPTYPSTASMRRDLRRTADYYAHVSRGRQHVRATLTRYRCVLK